MRETLDGRHLRRERGRTKVVDTVIDLISSQGAIPSAKDVARGAGVSEATVFRYFETLEDLQRMATERYFERHADLFAIPDLGEGRFEDRTQRFARSRCRLWSTIEPFATFGRGAAHRRPDLAEALHVVRTSQHDQVVRHFAPELSALTPATRQDRAAAVATLTSFESWSQQRHDLDRSDRQITRSWSDAIRLLLSA